MRAPAWTATIDEALVLATRGLHLLSAATPVNAKAERIRLVAAATEDMPLAPSWSYAPHPTSDARARLERIARSLDTLGDDPLAQVYAARAEEAALEAELIEHVGGSRLPELAERRFPRVARSLTKKNDALLERWRSAKTTSSDVAIACDDDHVDSLLSCMRREVGKRALPFRVVVHPPLSSLAATGDGVILIASGRPISPTAALRTVLHEIEGHALPRTRAARQELAIFRIGTARGVDDQEGLALVIEERAGFLEGERMRDLAARASAVEAMRSGADFGEVVRFLRSDHARAPSEAVAIAERIFRGSDGRAPGLGRESVYAQSFLRVKSALEKFPDAEEVIRSGQVSVDAWSALRPYLVT